MTDKMNTLGKRLFHVLYLLVQIVSISMFIVLIRFVQNEQEGFSNLFSWHPFLCVSGLVLLQAQSILIYRVLSNVRKPVTKTLHAMIHACAIAFAIGGYVCLLVAFDRGVSLPKHLHAFLGLFTMILFIAQYFVGFFVFLFPGAAMTTRATTLPYHVYFGIATFVLGCVTALTMLDAGGRSSKYTIGILITIFCLLVTFLATNSDFRRSPDLSSEEVQASSVQTTE